MNKPQYGDPFSQFAAMFQQYKLPGLDVSAIVDARRKDVDQGARKLVQYRKMRNQIACVEQAVQQHATEQK